MQSNIGELLDSLGLQADLDENDLISSAVVLLETIDDDGEVSLQVVEDSTTSWLKRIGMLQVALSAALTECGHRVNEDDD